MSDPFGVSKALFSPQVPFQRVLHGTNAQAGRKIIRGNAFLAGKEGKAWTTVSEEAASQYSKVRSAKHLDPSPLKRQRGKATVVEAIGVGVPEKGALPDYRAYRPGQVFPVRRRPPRGAPLDEQPGAARVRLTAKELGIAVSKAMFSPQLPFYRGLHGTSARSGRKIMREGFRSSGLQSNTFLTQSEGYAASAAENAASTRAPVELKRKKNVGKPTVIEAIAIGSGRRRGGHSVNFPGGVTTSTPVEMNFPPERVFPVRRRPAAKAADGGGRPLYGAQGMPLGRSPKELTRMYGPPPWPTNRKPFEKSATPVPVSKVYLGEGQWKPLMEMSPTAREMWRRGMRNAKKAKEAGLTGESKAPAPRAPADAFLNGRPVKVIAGGSKDRPRIVDDYGQREVSRGRLGFRRKK